MLARLVALSTIVLLPASLALAQGTLERIAQRNEFRIGYRTDARPLSFQQGGEAMGYSVDICRRVAAAVREQVKRPEMKVTFVPVAADKRFDAVANGDVDIECGATTITFGRQERVDFTMMTFVTGGTVLTTSKSGSTAMDTLAGKRIAVIRDTTTATALAAYLKENLIDARVVQVADRATGMSRLQQGEVDAFASDQVVLLGAAMEALEKDPAVSFSFGDELFSYEPYAFMVRRNDADFRLVVNRAIAQMFRNGDQARLFQTWIGSVGVRPSPLLIAMYQVQTWSE
jgi:ABC-type amino acid transport substrate-binding protein